jgi:tetratricopeptide (TPR) repeat protein
MQVLERTKSEVQAKAEKMSDFLRMEYLENCTRKFMDKEILRYCFPELSRLYERNVMYPDAIKYLIKFEEVTQTNTEKRTAYLKEIELLIKGGYYDKVEFTHKKIREISSPKEMFEIDQKIIDLYKQEADKANRANKYSPALKVYERLLPLVKPEEKTEIKRKLAFLYNKLGRVKESIEIEREMQR